MTTPSPRILKESPADSHILVKATLQAVASLLILAAILFLSSGRINWAMAWVYLSAYILVMAMSLWLLDPGLIVERSGFKPGAKKWDLFLVVPIGVILPLAILLIAGLDQRFGWSTVVPLWLQLVGVFLLVLGYGIVFWSMLVNKFFSTVVRIQTDRGHQVITQGPYRYVRHPGYLGVIASFALGPTLMLNSLWAWVPAALIIILTLVRTVLEDRTLRAELEGYRDYAHRVRWRLLPGIW